MAGRKGRPAAAGFEESLAMLRMLWSLVDCVVLAAAVGRHCKVVPTDATETDTGTETVLEIPSDLQ